MEFRKEKGVTLIALTITVIMLMIVTGSLIYNTKNQISINKIDKLYNDIETLSVKVNEYYLEYGEIPTICKYISRNDFEDYMERYDGSIKVNESINKNDGQDYYVIDLEKLDGLSLNYGYNEQYKTIKENGRITDNIENIESQIYIINKVSHHIYFPHGLIVDDVLYFTKDNSEKNSDFKSYPIEYETFTVEFDLAGGTGSNAKTQKVKAGEYVTEPTAPTKSDSERNYEFLGWYYQKFVGTTGSGEDIEELYEEDKFDFSKPITQDYKLYARYVGEAIMMPYAENEAFWSDTGSKEYRKNITKIEFIKAENQINIPSNVVEQWNVEADDKCAEIKAYLTDDGTNTGKYKGRDFVLHMANLFGQWFDNRPSKNSCNFNYFTESIFINLQI